MTIDPPIVLAPMAGVTNAAFRSICAGFGAGLYVSEMVTARALVEGNSRTLRMVSFAADERYRSIQLYGVEPRTVGRAVDRLVGEIGVDHVDLNFGCPAPKVTRLGGGAALPLHHLLFASVVSAAVRAAEGVPITVKLRIGLDSKHPTALAAGRIAAEAGAAAVTLHARTAEQRYSGSADWTAIAELKQALDVPVLGNGDIWEADDALAMVVATGCDGVVVGRGALGRPWLFRDLADAFAGRPAAPDPSLGEVVEVMVKHAELACAMSGEDIAMREFRKQVGWYLTGFPIGGEPRRRLGQVSTLDELVGGLGLLDQSLPFPPSAKRAVRGHSDGPRPVVLPANWLTSLDDPTPPAGGDILVSGG